jgi:hypothetical protein
MLAYSIVSVSIQNGRFNQLQSQSSLATKLVSYVKNIYIYNVFFSRAINLELFGTLIKLNFLANHLCFNM